MADIPINAVTRRVQFTGNTGLGPFAFTFEILANTDIAVYKNATLLTLTTDYTVTINVNGTGSVTLTGSGSGTALVASDYLTIIGKKPLARTTDFTTAGDLLASALNDQLDANVIMNQQIDERVDRALRQDPDDVDGDMTIPAKADRLGKLLQFNATTGNPEAVTPVKAFATGGMSVFNFTGDGSDTTFVLSRDPGGENNTQIYIDGVYQQKDTYSVSGTTITFSTAPPNLSTIEVMVVDTFAVGETNASSVSFTQAGSSTERTVQLKLQESVSVKDFGAVGDGLTDDTTAFQNAISSGKNIFVPYTSAGYKVSASLGTLQEGQSIFAHGLTKIAVDTSTTDFVTITATTENIISNIRWEGSGTANGTGIKLSIGGTSSDFASGLLIENCWIKGFNKGYAPDNSFDVKFINCEIRNNRYGLFLEPIGGGAGSYIATYEFFACRFFGNSTRDMKLLVSGNAACRGINFFGCTFDPTGHPTNPSMQIENGALINWDGCYFEAGTTGAPRQIWATGSINLKASNSIWTGTGGVDLDNSEMTFDNCWSFSASASPGDNKDPIIADATSRVFIKDSRMRSNASDFVGCETYVIENSEVKIPVGGTNAYYKFRSGGSNATFTNQQYMDTSDTEIFSIDNDGLKFVGSDGIRFQGNAASTDTILNDYEEGTHNATTAPETSGTLTFANPSLSYTKIGRMITVNGILGNAVVSSPVGAYFTMTLPTAIKSGSIRYRIGGSVRYIQGTTVPYQGSEGSSTINIYIDVSTITAGDDFFLSFSYFA